MALLPCPATTTQAGQLVHGSLGVPDPPAGCERRGEGNEGGWWEVRQQGLLPVSHASAMALWATTVFVSFSRNLVGSWPTLKEGRGEKTHCKTHRSPEDDFGFQPVPLPLPCKLLTPFPSLGALSSAPKSRCSHYGTSWLLQLCPPGPSLT